VSSSNDQVAGTVAGEARAVAPRYRLAVFLLATSVGILGLQRALAPVGDSVTTWLGARVPAFYLTMAGGLLFGHWCTFRAVEPRRWAAIGMDRGALAWRRLLAGTALGALAVGVPSLALLATGWLRIEAAPAGDWGRTALITLIVLVPAALWEELLTRGYVFTLLRERLGARRAIVTMAVVFGAMHLQNAGATLQSVGLVALAGIFLGAIRVATESLYAAWLAHLSWNFVMAGVLHSAVSGIGMGAPNYRTVDAGPDWATGGPWGPEAGLLTGAGLLLGIYLMLRRGRRGVDQ
jgi:hypothetical protein